ncbi:MAG TPA: RNA-binding domain-containing protein [Paenisporosarcina sp.]|nr:RNA-binding domain-containing protein [Paenisporosarcina sp.]
MYKESDQLELKSQVTDGLKKEVVAFVNTNGGKILIGIDDEGIVVGLINAPKDLESISSMLRDGIRPEVISYTQLLIREIEGKDIIEINVSKGSRRPYHLTNKGLKPSGVFMRHGTTASPVSEESIRKMIMESDGTDYETMRSIKQELSFGDSLAIFKNAELTFGESQQRTLGLLNEEGYWTNLGFLLSDQCLHTIKCAVYQGETKLAFEDRKEFSGSIMKQISEVYDFINLHNPVSSTFVGLKREDERSFPTYAVREALINAVVHRDYAFSGSILIHIFSNRIEIISLGGLVQGLSVGDIELGVSQSRNPKLANVLYRMKWIESYGTGLQRIKESYGQVTPMPSWTITPNAFSVTLPKRKSGEEDNLQVSDWIKEQDEFSRKELENYLRKSKSSVRDILAELQSNKIIKQVGKGRATKYKVIH